MPKASGRQRGIHDYAQMQNGGGVAAANAAPAALAGAASVPTCRALGWPLGGGTFL